MLRAAIYIRVSARKQEEHGTSLESQKQECLRYCQEHGYVAKKEHIYTEVHTAKVYRERQVLSQLRQAARRKEFDVVVVYAFDRLARKQVHQAVIIEELEHHGIVIACVTEVFDNSAIGQFMRSTYAFMAEVEREKIFERMERGRRQRLAEGKLLGGGPSLYGYWWNAQRTAYLINEEEAAVVRRIFALAKEGMSINKICQVLSEEGIQPRKKLGRWSRSTVGAILANPAYMGKAITYKYRFDRTEEHPNRRIRRSDEDRVILPDGTIPAIIDTETFEAVQPRLAENKKYAGRNNKNPQDALLRCGFVKCGYCGGNMTVNRNRQKGVANYTCSRGNKQLGGKCIHFYISCRILDKAVWERVIEIIQHPELVAKRVQALKQEDVHTAEVNAVERSLEKVSRQIKNYNRALKVAEDDDVVDRIVVELETLAVQKRTLEKELAQVHAQQSSWQEIQANLEKFERWCLQMQGKVANATYVEKRNACEVLGIKALVWRHEHEPWYEISDETTIVSGMVKRPGVYTLPADARVYALLQAAGGPLPKANLIALNLAAKLTDGEEVYVTLIGEIPPTYMGGVPGPGSGTPGGNNTGQLTNINTASANEMRQSLHISSTTAQNIVNYRLQHGLFTSIDQLLQIVSRSIYDKIRGLVTV